MLIPQKKTKDKPNPSTSFIQYLDKYKLAFLFKYRYDSMMPYNKDAVLEAMTNLSISVDDVDALIEEYKSSLKTKTGCQRCCSDYSIPFEVVTDSSRYADDAWSSKIKTETYYECGICGFSPYNKIRIVEYLYTQLYKLFPCRGVLTAKCSNFKGYFYFSSALRILFL